AALTGFQQGRYRVLVATDLAARGIHVEQIAHVINYDLPEVAENFIHRVGRTGRAGSHGVASTLFANEQRSELFQLERTLGIRMERIPVDGHVSQNRERTQDPAPRKQTGYRPTMVALPGEVLQAQLWSDYSERKNLGSWPFVYTDSAHIRQLETAPYTGASGQPGSC